MPCLIRSRSGSRRSKARGELVDGRRLAAGDHEGVDLGELRRPPHRAADDVALGERGQVLADVALQGEHADDGVRDVRGSRSCRRSPVVLRRPPPGFRRPLGPARRGRPGPGREPGCQAAASASTPSTSRGPGRVTTSPASTAHTAAPAGQPGQDVEGLGRAPRRARSRRARRARASTSAAATCSQVVGRGPAARARRAPARRRRRSTMSGTQ